MGKVFYHKTYWFGSPKGYFRVKVTGSDVLMEARPDHFISARDLWMTRPEYERTRDKEEKELIKAKHLDEYEEMLNLLRLCDTLEQQDNYIIGEMKKQGYFIVKP